MTITNDNNLEQLRGFLKSICKTFQFKDINASCRNSKGQTIILFIISCNSKQAFQHVCSIVIVNTNIVNDILIVVKPLSVNIDTLYKLLDVFYK